MPTIKPRVTITMTEEQLQKIEDLRFKKRFKNQTQAILALIDAGFETLKTKPTSAEDIIAQNHDRQMTKKYHALDDHGKDMVDFVLEKEYSRSMKELKKSEIPSHLMPVAAHNDKQSEEQRHLMREDLDEL